MALRRDSTVLRWTLHALGVGARASHGQLQLYDIRSCKTTDRGCQESLVSLSEVQEAAPPGHVERNAQLSAHAVKLRRNRSQALEAENKPGTQEGTTVCSITHSPAMRPLQAP